MSDIRAATIGDADGTSPITLTKQSAAKHWANTDSGTTINDSFNTASNIDNGTGNHASTLINAMVNSFYVVTGSNIGSGAGGDSGEIFVSNHTGHTTTKYEFRTRNNNGSYYDNYINQRHLSGDLA